MNTIDTRVISEYLDDPSALDEVHSWVARGASGHWHVDETCWMLLDKKKGKLRAFKASLLQGAGKICFRCGAKRMDGSAHENLQHGWGSALFLAHNSQFLQHNEQETSLEALGGTLSAARNLLEGIGELTDSERRPVERKCREIERLARKRQQKVSKKLISQRNDILVRAALEGLAPDTFPGGLSAQDTQLLGATRSQKTPDALGAAFAAWKAKVLAGSSPDASSKASALAVTAHHLTRLDQLAQVPQGGTTVSTDVLTTASDQWLAHARKQVDRLARAWNQEYASRLAQTQPVAVGVTYVNDLAETEWLATAALEAWDWLETVDGARAVALLPAVVAHALERTSHSWGWTVRVHIAGPCSSGEHLSTALALWDPESTTSSYQDLAAALEAAQRL